MQTFRETIPFRKVFVCKRALHRRRVVSKCALLEKAQSLLPPLCKGRWIAKRDGRGVELNPRLNNPSVTYQ